MDGREKAFIDLAGKPLIVRVIDRLAAQVDAIVINANGDLARFDPFGLPVVADTVPGFAGPLAGLLAGMRWAELNRPQARFLVSVATDTPFFPDDLASRLRARVPDERTIAIATSGGNRHPVFGCWPVALADDLAEFLDSGEGGKVMAFAQRHRVIEIAFAETEIAGTRVDPFFNINTPADLEAAHRVVEGASHAA